MSSESAWQWQYKDVAEADELRIPECGEAFLTLMLTMTGDNSVPDGSLVGTSVSGTRNMLLMIQRS